MATSFEVTSIAGHRVNHSANCCYVSYVSKVIVEWGSLTVPCCDWFSNSLISKYKGHQKAGLCDEMQDGLTELGK